MKNKEHLWISYSRSNPNKGRKSEAHKCFFVYRRTFSRKGKIKNQKLYDKYFKDRFTGYIGKLQSVILIEDSRN